MVLAMELQVIAGGFAAHSPSPARFAELAAPWDCAISACLQEAPAVLWFPSQESFVQAALALARGRPVLGALGGSWLVYLSDQLSFYDSDWAGEDAGVHFT